MNLEQKCDRAGLCTPDECRHLACLSLRGSHLSASARTRAHLPCASSTSFRVSMVILACLRLYLSPMALPYASSASLSPWSVSPIPKPPRPTASPASLFPGQSLLLGPAPGPAKKKGSRGGRLICLAWCAHELAQLHSCSKLIPPFLLQTV